MSGHSKWSTIKRKKGAKDAQRGKLFTKLIREIITAARAGGGDVNGNNRLRAAVTAARDANMPSANIDRAIKRGTGELEGTTYDEVNYEGYGPGGVALFIDTLTDNRNRTVSEVRHILSKNGGSLGEAGCVAWMFDLRGVITLDAADLDEESAMELVLGAGAEDFSMDDGNCLVYTGPAEVATVREALEADGAKVIAAEQSWIPKNTVEVDAKVAEQTLRLLEALEDQDDVQRVSSNFDISEEVLRSLGE